MGLIGYGAAWDLGRAIAGASRKATRDRYATVTRRDPDGVTWGTIAGASGEVPLGGSLADAEVGDVVAVDWRGGVPVASGNATSPAVGARRVEGAVAPVRAASVAAQGAARAAKSVADAAQRVAEAVGQHFFADDGGIHVTAATQDEWGANHAGANVLINSIGQLFRDGLNNLLTLTTEGNARALTIWDGLGNAAENIRAIIGSVIQLGKTGESHAVIDYHSLQLVDKDTNDPYFHVSDLRDTTGYATITDVAGIETSDATQTLTLSVPLASTDSFEITGVQIYVPNDSETIDVPLSDVTVDTSTSPYVVHVDYSESIGRVADLRVTYKTDSDAAKAYTLGLRGDGNIGAMSVAEGYQTIADGGFSHAEGRESHASGIAAHAEGHGTAYGDYSHSEGCWSYAGGSCDHAEGSHCYAEGSAAHAEGDGTHAYGQAGHAEGIESSTGRRSKAAHAQNLGTIAASEAQTAMGRYNANDSSHALEVGNGTSDNARSNALTVGWDGTVEAGGDIRTVDSRFDSAASSLAENVYRTWSIRDADGRLVTYLQAAEYTDGRVATFLGARRVVSDANVDNVLTLGVLANGSCTVTVSDAAAWRSALGLGRHTSSVSLSNCTADSNSCWHNGIVATVTLMHVKLTSALAQGASGRAIGTVPAGYRPIGTMWVPVAINANDRGGAFIAINAAGAMTLYNRTNGSIATTTEINITATYAI